MTLNPGHVSDFTDSMAEAMEDAFKLEWKAVKHVDLPAQGEEDRRLLFSAIAQGVVKHLKDKANEAFKIDVRVTQTSEVLMKSDNPAAIPVSGGGGGTIGSGQADVKQLGNTVNMIVAEGKATQVEILTHE